MVICTAVKEEVFYIFSCILVTLSAEGAVLLSSSVGMLVEPGVIQSEPGHDDV